MGVNLYGGQRGNGRGSTRASSNLLEGPGDIASYPYYRSYFNDAMIPSITTMHRNLTNIAASMAIQLDPLLTSVCSKILGVDPREICIRSILTMGLPKLNLSFVNSLHTDHNDRIATLPSRDDMKKVFTHKELEFYDAWCKMFSYLSVPTTCCYLHVGETSKKTEMPDEPTRLLLFMVFADLGLVIPIDDEMVLQFAGHVAAHHTSAAILVVNNMVHYRSDSFTVLGWGASSAAG